jgi:hypothetical protein
MLETSYNRHISYCRRTHHRPRTRGRSCKSCSAAKAKCSFQPRCSRCVNKSLECVYENSAATRVHPQVDESSEPMSPQVLLPSSAGGDFTMDTLLASDEMLVTNTTQDVDWDTFDFSTHEISPLGPPSGLPCIFEAAGKITARGAFLLTEPNVKQVLEGVQAGVDTKNLSFNNIWDDQDASQPTQRSDADYLARLPVPDNVSQFAATTVMQKLLAFPRMMLRRETFPPFIHGHWYRASGAAELALSEPLVNCIGIAQVFASQNPESKPFLWRTIKMEQRSFIEKVGVPFLLVLCTKKLLSLKSERF